MKRKYAGVDEAIEALAAGRTVNVVDSEERENEGDFLTAAEKITPESLHFMASRGCGQVCVPVSAGLARRLNLIPMVPENTDLGATAFAIPLDHRNCKTGISPEERVYTIRAFLDPSSRAEDFVRPGHVFPLIARKGGVLRRPGHTEAAVDLAQMAGLAPAGVLCEICSEDGFHMAGRDELRAIAEKFSMLMITIDDLVRFRKTNFFELSLGCEVGLGSAV